MSIFGKSVANPDLAAFRELSLGEIGEVVGGETCQQQCEREMQCGSDQSCKNSCTEMCQSIGA